MSSNPLAINEQATDESGSQIVDIPPERTTKEPARSFLNRAKRDLNDDELSSPAARRFLIAEIERLDEENAQLRSFRDELYELKVEYTSLKSSASKDKTVEILSFVCLSVGSAGIGAAPSYSSTLNVWWIFLILSAILVMAGIIAKARR